MPKEFFPTIKADYPAYETFLEDSKTFQSDMLVGYKSDKSNRANVNTDITTTCAVEATFGASISLSSFGKYHFRIFVKKWSENPCFRFDSSGLPHNNSETVPLPLRKVPTPHFQRVHSCGNIFAYRTKTLEESEDNVRNDFKKGIKIFCEEAFLTSPSGKCLEIQLEAPHLDISQDDPLQGVNF